MLMFVDMGEGGVDEKITDFVDMGRVLQKIWIGFHIFKQNDYVFNIFTYMTNIRP